MVVLAALIAVTGIAWSYLLRTASSMSASSGAGAGLLMPQMRMPSTLDLLSLFAMWAVMMAAMMLPSAAPMFLLVARVNRNRRERASPTVPTGVFVAGYLIVWTMFSAAAALAQSGLHRAALLAPEMVSASPVFSGLLLMLAGAYQWMPTKYICLNRCRSPFSFLGSEWREGRGGALVMGLRYGLLCLGCCWALMALLFVAGVMNILWIAALAALVLLEKVSPGGVAIARSTGVLFLAWGAYLILAAAF